MEEADVLRDEILDAIRKTAADNNGKPLGRNRFEQLTGITEYDVGRYWPRWGDAVREAGFEPNTLNPRLDDHHLLEKYIGLVARLGHVPTNADLRLERQRDSSFPNAKGYERFGSKAGLIDRAVAYCIERGTHDATHAILSEAKTASPVVPDAGDSTPLAPMASCTSPRGTAANTRSAERIS